MKLKLLLLVFIFSLTLQSLGQNCKLNIYGQNTFEPGPGHYAALTATVYDTDYFQEPIYTISWSPAASVLYPTAAATYVNPTVATTYTVTATTQCGTVTDTFTVRPGCSTVAYAYSSSYCFSGSYVASAFAYGGVPPYSYRWSDGQTTATANFLPGLYTVTVTDSVGCKASDTTSILTPDIAMSANTMIVPGDSVYLYAYISNAYNTYTYSWEPSGLFNVPNAEFTYAHPKTTTTFTVTITDQCGGIQKDTVTVSMGCSLSSYTYSTPYFCPASSGTVMAYAGGGVQPYAYSWSTGQTTSSISNLSIGAYYVTIQDSNGCLSTSYTTIDKNSLFLDVYTSWYYFPDITTIEPGDSIGLEASLYDSAYYEYGVYYDSTITYSWAPSSSVTNPNSAYTYVHPTTTTTYTVTATTSCGSVSDTITIQMGCTASVGIYANPYACAADSGWAEAGVTSGVPPYTYAWSTGQTTSSINDLAVGSYSVMVTDGYGCSAGNSAFVYPQVPTASCGAYPNSIKPGDSTYLFVNPQLGDTGIIYYDNDLPGKNTYLWTPSASVTNPDSSHTYAHPGGTTTYTITITTPCNVITDTVVVTVTCNGYNQQICVVTTDTAINKNVIIWGRNNSPPSGSFNIYSLNSSNSYQLIGSVPDTALSEFIDNSSMPSSQAYTYVITTVDSCGESSFSQPQSTIYLQAIIDSGKDSLYWTPYVGFTTAYYKIYRGPALDSLTLLDSVSGRTTYYVDHSPPAGCVYLIETENPAGSCMPTHKHISPHEQIISSSVSLSNGGIPHKPSFGNLSELNVSPNPSNGLFNINYILPQAGNVNLSVVDEFGRIVYTRDLDNQHAGVNYQAINIQGVAEGIYSLRLITNTGIVVKKIVVIRN